MTGALACFVTYSIIITIFAFWLNGAALQNKRIADERWSELDRWRREARTKALTIAEMDKALATMKAAVKVYEAKPRVKESELIPELQAIHAHLEQVFTIIDSARSVAKGKSTKS